MRIALLWTSWCHAGRKRYYVCWRPCGCVIKWNGAGKVQPLKHVLIGKIRHTSCSSRMVSRQTIVHITCCFHHLITQSRPCNTVMQVWFLKSHDNLAWHRTKVCVQLLTLEIHTRKCYATPELFIASASLGQVPCVIIFEIVFSLVFIGNLTSLFWWI